MDRTIAALFVDPTGIYSGLDGVEVWGEDRDARNYSGPYPVVAHPPCSRWCQLARLVEAMWGYRPGDDGGCFASALESVRKYGGILEHPAYSMAWTAHDLNKPPSFGGWVTADFHGGWTCHVEQYYYGHRARKATWLYAFSTELPSMKWVYSRKTKSNCIVGAGAFINDSIDKKKAYKDSRIFLGKKEASATPVEFRDLLISIARSVYDQ